MDNKIPTAEKYGESLLPRGITWYKEFNEMMIGFAQLHVEAALKAASEKATFSYRLSHDSDEEKAGFKMVATKESIINAYPKENII